MESATQKSWRGEASKAEVMNVKLMMMREKVENKIEEVEAIFNQESLIVCVVGLKTSCFYRRVWNKMAVI